MRFAWDGALCLRNAPVYAFNGGEKPVPAKI